MKCPCGRAALVGSILLAGMVVLQPGTVQAQTPGTYEEAPFQQGSLMYRPSGRPRPPRVTQHRVVPPATSTRQSGYSYSQGGGYTYYNYAPQRGYVYAPPAGAPQPRRGLFGWFR